MPVIKQIFAYIIADKGPDDEGIPGFLAPDGTMLPLVGADLQRIKALKDVVQDMANRSGKKITVAKFTMREDIEVVEPVVGPTTRHTMKSCPACGTGLDAASGFKNSAAPSIGDVTICIQCEAILRYGNDMDLEKVHEEALKELPQEDRALLDEAVRAIRQVKAQRRGPNGGEGFTH